MRGPPRPQTTLYGEMVHHVYNNFIISQRVRAKADKQKTIDVLKSRIDNLDVDLKDHASTGDQLAQVRKQVTSKISKQHKDGLQWRTTKVRMCEAFFAQNNTKTVCSGGQPR